MIGSELAVQEMTASNSCSRCGSSASRSAVPPKRLASFSPRSSVRLASAIAFGSRPLEAFAVCDPAARCHPVDLLRADRLAKAKAVTMHHLA